MRTAIGLNWTKSLQPALTPSHLGLGQIASHLVAKTAIRRGPPSIDLDPV
jgi:hypothetical protein